MHFEEMENLELERIQTIKQGNIYIYAHKYMYLYFMNHINSKCTFSISIFF